ncbi:hypothetical protein RCL1_008132 [Eukaryota sp. TZLM3-RCL]
MIVRKHGGLISKGRRCSNIAFADEINILAKSESSAAALLHVFKTGIECYQCLTTAVEKFGCIGYRKLERLVDTFTPKLYYDEVEIPSLSNEAKRFRLLGQQI